MTSKRKRTSDSVVATDSAPSVATTETLPEDAQSSVSVGTVSDAEGKETDPKSPTLEDLTKARLVAVATVQPRSCPIVVAGLLCTPQERTYEVQYVRDLGESFMRALAEDDQITVRVIE